MYNINGIAWEVELQSEVKNWIPTLPKDDQGIVTRNIDRLEEKGNLLTHPYTSQLKSKLRKLRFHLSTGQQRITYFIAPERKIILLTVFRKTKQRETKEINRAIRAMNTFNE